MKNKVNYILNYYGINNQLNKLVEELFELKDSILLDLRVSKEHISNDTLAEMADVINLIDQIKTIPDNKEKIEKMKNEKIERELLRIKVEQTNKESIFNKKEG